MLTGLPLDYVIAQIQGEQVYLPTMERICADIGEAEFFRPSSNWAQGGPCVISRLSAFEQREGYAYCAMLYQPDKWTPKKLVWATGTTLLIAACICLVKAVYGDTVEIPDELVNT